MKSAFHIFSMSNLPFSILYTAVKLISRGK
nr:MAG TPA: hypothetical protein [Caudoviricetes sp.]